MSALDPKYIRLRDSLLAHPGYAEAPLGEKQSCQLLVTQVSGAAEGRLPEPDSLARLHTSAMGEIRRMIKSGILPGFELPGEEAATTPTAPEAAPASPVPLANDNLGGVGTDEGQPPGIAAQTASTSVAPNASASSAPACAYDEPWEDLPIHPLAEMFPPMLPDELQALAKSIEAVGLLDEVVVDNGLVVDGRSRQSACRLARVRPTYRQWDGQGSLVGWIVAKNLHRRHLTDQQRALVAAKVKGAFEEEAKGRSRANLSLRHGSDGLDPGRPTEGRSAARAAQALGVSRDSVNKASRILTKATPGLLTAVQAGEVSLDAAAAVAGLDPSEQTATVEAGTVAETAKRIRNQKKACRSAAPETLPVSNFSTGSGRAAPPDPVPIRPDPDPVPESSRRKSASEGPAPVHPVPGPPAPTTPEEFHDRMLAMAMCRSDFAVDIIHEVAEAAALDVVIVENDPAKAARELASLLVLATGRYARADYEGAHSWLDDVCERLCRAVWAEEAPKSDDNQDDEGDLE